MTWLNDAEVKTAEDRDDERKASLVAAIETQRKAAEAEGVTINGIRYSGDPTNRQALGEALTFAQAASLTEFFGWKDSDGGFHSTLPVADVQQAYQAIGQRRSQLIGLEGQYQSQVDAGTLTSADGLNWDV